MELLAPPQVKYDWQLFQFLLFQRRQCIYKWRFFHCHFPFPKGHPGFTLPLIIIAVFDYLGLAGDTRVLQAYNYIYIYYIIIYV